MPDDKLVRRCAPHKLWEDRPEVGGWMIFCPACRCGHLFDDARWTFDGNEEAPSFTPSMKVTGHLGTVDGQEVSGVCHSVITKGKIHFCDDCTHALKGQIVPMEKF